MVFAAAMSLYSAAGWSAEPVKIRMSWIAPISNWGSLLLEKKELAQHLGKSYVLEPVRYVGTPQQITALANGELEIANLAFSTLPIAIQNANLDDLRVIADEFQDGAPGYYSQEYMVLTDGPIKKIEDLKGKVVAINAAGGAVDVASRTMLRRHGLEANRDYVMVEAPLPTMRAMLAKESRPDPDRAAVRVRPSAAEHRQAAVRQPRHSRVDAASGVVRAAIVHRQEPRRHDGFHGRHAAHHALVSRPEKSRRGRGDPGRLTKQPPERFDWPFTAKDYYHAPGMKPDLEALQRNIALMKDLGFTKSDIDVKKYSDLSLIEAAACATEIEMALSGQKLSAYRRLSGARPLPNGRAASPICTALNSAPMSPKPSSPSAT